MTMTVAAGAWAQNGLAPPDLRDLVIGEPFSTQPADFQEFACGTGGGPSSIRIGGFADFAICPPEASGLREVQFRYDDELAYRALAARNALVAEALLGTRLGSFHILVSALFDDAGILRGIRAVTDDRVSDRARRSSYGMAEFVRAIYGSAGWTCIDIPPEEGEQPLGNLLVKQDCRKLTDDGRVITTRSRLLQRAGQTVIDPANGQLRAGLFISTAAMEIYQADADGNPIYGGSGAPVVAQAETPPVPTDPREAFLAGATIDCPGCDLAGANLKRRNLAGADLANADLSRANLHRAILAGANLAGANLTGANLNVADLKRARLAGADLTGALLYQTDAAGADFTGATLDRIVADNARFTNATMVGAHWTGSYALTANLAGTNLTDAILVGTAFHGADLQRATLAGADLTDVSFYDARLRAANLSGATALRADFLRADLSDAAFIDADLTEARLLRARTTGIDLTGATLTEAIMPDGRLGE
ncbi:MAG: pentapeptide repeat-containing protein [Bauldia sp.]|nr:pentapeptide repeat-containing protein [Bauldia sp.]